MKNVLTAALLAASMLSVVLLPSTDASARSAAVAWSGKWNRLASEIDPGGPTAFTLHQLGNHLTGSIRWKGCTTRKGGSIVGWAEGRSAVLAVRQVDGTLVLANLKLSANGGHISGSYQVTAGTCSAVGPFTAARAS
jgi:hypothetical protein